MHLKQALVIKRPDWGNRHDKLIFQHDNARPHVAKPVKNYLENVEWEVLPHPPYSPDIAPSDYYLFDCMNNDLLDSASLLRMKHFFDTEFVNCRKDGLK